MMPVESRPGSLTGMPDDRLGTVAVSLVVSELQWAPDVTPAVMDRISRDAVAYPELFDRRVGPPPPRPTEAPPPGRSARRALGRLAVFAVILAVIVVLIVFAATASGADATAAADGILAVLTEVA
jgi:hypothetical protein